jgi:streptogramin lyase
MKVLKVRSMLVILVAGWVGLTPAVEARQRAVTPPPPNQFLLNEDYGSIVSGPDGHVWIWAETGLARVLDSGTIEYAARGLPQAFGLILGADGAFWGAGYSPDMSVIVRATTQGVVSTMGVRPSTALELAAGHDGRIWFTEGTKDRIGTVTGTGAVQEIALDPMSDVPGAITAGPDASIWFACRRRIGHVTSFGQFEWFSTESFFTLRPGDFPPRGNTSHFNSIAATSDGSVWLAIAAEYDKYFSVQGGAIVHMLPTGQLTIALQRDDTHSLTKLTVGPDGALWFVDTRIVGYGPATFRIVRLGTDGVETDFDLASPPPPLQRYTGVAGFAFDGEGSLWVLMQAVYYQFGLALLKFPGVARVN